MAMIRFFAASGPEAKWEEAGRQNDVASAGTATSLSWEVTQAWLFLVKIRLFFLDRGQTTNHRQQDSRDVHLSRVQVTTGSSLGCYKQYVM